MLKPAAVPPPTGGGGGIDGIPPGGAGLGPFAIGGGGGNDPGIGGGGALGGFPMGAPGGSPCGGGGGGGGAWGGGGIGLGGTPGAAVPLAVEGGCGLFASGGLDLKYNCSCIQVSIPSSVADARLNISNAHHINKMNKGSKKERKK